MKQFPISVAGANTLLGQHLLARLATSEAFQVLSLHDELSLQGIDSIADSTNWNICPSIAEHYRDVPLLAPEAPAFAPVLACFLPDQVAQEIEAQHLLRGTQVITHAEYARLTTPLVTHAGLGSFDPDAPHIATPNCTTAMCALPLHALDEHYHLQAVTITALQAISGTDLPGMPAHAIHDQVVGHLPGESDALKNELDSIFSHAFPIHTFATRVPVWRGHTLTISVSLSSPAELAQIINTLRSQQDIQVIAPFDRPQRGRPLFHAQTPTVTISNLRLYAAITADSSTSSDKSAGSTLLMTVTGDNLEGATTGLMQSTLERLRQFPNGKME